MLTIKQLAASLQWFNERRKGVIFILLAVATGIAAQLVLLGSIQGQDLTSYFDLTQWWEKAFINASPLPGFPIYLLAIVFFLLGLHYLKVSPAPFGAHTEMPANHAPRLGFWLTSLGLGLAIAIYAATANRNDPSGHVFAGLWLFSIALLIYSELSDADWRPPQRSQILAWLKAHWVELLGIAALVVAAFLIRVINLEFYPYSFMNDEGQMGSNGMCLLQGDCTNLFNLGWAEQSMLAFLPSAIGVTLFGRTALAVRLASATIGTLSTLAAYLFTRETLGRRLAWMAAVLLATLPLHIHFSRLGVDNILDSLTAPVILWLIFRGMKTGSRLYYLLAGMVGGLCLYSYQGSLLAPALGLLAFIYAATQVPSFLRAHRKNLSTYILAGLIVGLPMLGFYSTHSDMFLSRFKAEGVVNNGILQKDTQASGENTAAVLTVDFLRSTLVYIVTPASYGFFDSPDPYLPWLAAVFFVFGLVYVIRSIRNPLYLALFAWFWAPVILGSTLTSGPPASQRMLMSMPPLAIITALGISTTFDALQGPGTRFFKYFSAVALIVVLYTGFSGLWFYFNTYHVGHYFEDATNEFTYETRYDIEPLGSQGRVYLITDPNTPYLDFPNFSFFAPEVDKTMFPTVNRQTLAALPRDKDALFIATAGREADIQIIRQWIPGGQWHVVPRRFQPDLVLYYSYKITKEQLAAFSP